MNSQAQLKSLFPVTCNMLNHRGQGCAEFTKFAIVILNQIVLPFTNRWLRRPEQEVFGNPAQC